MTTTLRLPVRFANALEAANRHPYANAEQKRAADTLQAQKDTASWAFVMLLIAGAETTVTLVGVILVGLTLSASRAAARDAKRQADAAEKSVEGTRAQVRAYVSICAFRLSFMSGFVPGKACPQIVITAQNDGQTPARKFSWYPTLEFISDGRRRRRDLGAIGSEIRDQLLPQKSRLKKPHFFPTWTSLRSQPNRAAETTGR